MTSKEYKKYLERIAAKEKDIEATRMSHKCFKCYFGRWTGVKYFCMLPECVKEQNNSLLLNIVNKG